MTVTKAVKCVSVLAAVLALAACANGGAGSQQPGAANSQPQATMPSSGGGY